jgi:hypothetical protein
MFKNIQQNIFEREGPATLNYFFSGGEFWISAAALYFLLEDSW